MTKIPNTWSLPKSMSPEAGGPLQLQEDSVLGRLSTAALRLLWGDVVTVRIREPAQVPSLLLRTSRPGIPEAQPPFCQMSVVIFPATQRSALELVTPGLESWLHNQSA